MKISYILPITTCTGVRLTELDHVLEILADTFESVINQSIPNWEMIVVVEKKLIEKVNKTYSNVLANLNIRDHLINKKITFQAIDTNNNARACNIGLIAARGQFIGVIQAGDKLAEFASYELIKTIIENRNVQFIYTDHDHLDLNGHRFQPFFKPDLSPDLLYCQNYINNLVIVKRTILKKIGGWDEDHKFAYDYSLNLSAITHLIKLDKLDPKSLSNESPIKHINKILYHQRASVNLKRNGEYLIEHKPIRNIEIKQSIQGLNVLKQFFKKQGRVVKVTAIKPKLYRHHWPIPKPEPLVSLIIPTKNGYEILKTCVESIIKKTTYKNYEILIVDNQSNDNKTLNYMTNLESKYQNIKILKYNKSFNYSAINNLAVTKANGTILGLINNDTEVITPEWLSEMVSHAIRREIGAVGAMLYYPDGTIQHGGVIVGMHGVADHAFKGKENNHKNDYFNFLSSIRNPKAVTAAILLIKKDLFIKIGGFDDKNLKIAFNDVDLCLKCRSNSAFNIWIPTAELFHHESKTRSRNKSNTKINHIESEFLKKKWSIKFSTHPD